MISVEIINGYFVLLAVIGFSLGGAAFFSVVLAFPLYNDLIAKLRREHPEIYARLRGQLPVIMQQVVDWHQVDNTLFLEFLDDEQQELSPCTLEAKRKYQQASLRNKKFLQYWIGFLLTGAASIVLAFFLVIVFKVVKL